MELNREQIIKALECCIHVNCGGIAICPRRENCGNRFVCSSNLKKDALLLIKQLTEENERLHASCTELTRKCASLTEENERLKSVEFTCGFIKPHKVLECPIFDEIARTKADTVRKMQERLEMKFGTYVIGYKIPLTVALEFVNQIAKEMLEGEKDNV